MYTQAPAIQFLNMPLDTGIMELLTGWQDLSYHTDRDVCEIAFAPRKKSTFNNSERPTHLGETYIAGIL